MNPCWRMPIPSGFPTTPHVVNISINRAISKRLISKGTIMSECEKYAGQPNSLRGLSMQSIREGDMVGKQTVAGNAASGGCVREQTVGEHFDYQINRALETIQQLREKKKFLEDRGYAQMSISSYERQFGLYVSGPF